MRLIFCLNDLSKGVFDSQVLPLVKASDHVNYLFSERGHVASIIEILYNLALRKYEKIYVRDPKSYLLIYFFRLLALCRIEVLYDFRGAVADECRYQNQSWLKVLAYSCLERFAYRTATKVSAVSNNFKNYLLDKYGARKNVFVFPCCASHIVRTNRQMALRFVYVGSLSQWQNFDVIAKAFIRIRKSFPDSTFTIITNDTKSAKICLDELSLYDVTVKSVKNRDIVTELSQYSFGFIFRDSDIINHVASPIKLSEYICAGLVPIYTGKIGDFTESILFQKVSINYDEGTGSLDAIKGFLSDKMVRDKIYSLAEKFSWETMYLNHPFADSM